MIYDPDRKLGHSTRALADYTWWVRILNLKEYDPKILPDLAKSRSGVSAAQKVGWNNYEPLRKYAAWHDARDKNVMVPSLEEAGKRRYYGLAMYTVMEQSGDRVAVHNNLTDFMYLGAIPAARNHLTPFFSVRYAGFSKELAGLVLDDTTEQLRWTGFNFEPQAQQGVHNLGCVPTGPFRVQLKRENGDVITTVSHPGLNGIKEDLQPSLAPIEFASVPAETVRVTVLGPKEEITEANNSALIRSL